jgi:hypothetical protein
MTTDRSDKGGGIRRKTCRELTEEKSRSMGDRPVYLGLILLLLVGFGCIASAALPDPHIGPVTSTDCEYDDGGRILGCTFETTITNTGTAGDVFYRVYVNYPGNHEVSIVFSMEEGQTVSAIAHIGIIDMSHQPQPKVYYELRPTEAGDSNSGTIDISPLGDFPTIMVLSPNGFEQWVPGSQVTIRWSYQGDVGSSVKIKLLKGSTTPPTVLLVINPAAPIGSGGLGSYDWTVPVSVSAGNEYRVSVLSTLNEAYFDRSNDFFAIGVDESIQYSATVTGGQNTVIQSSDGAFGTILRGSSKTLSPSVILNNLGDTPARVDARFADSIGGFFGLISGSNVLFASNFAMGPSGGSLVALMDDGTDVQVATAAMGTTDLDARLSVPADQLPGAYSGNVILTFSNV